MSDWMNQSVNEVLRNIIVGWNTQELPKLVLICIDIQLY